MSQLSEQAQNLLQLIPESGSIGNVTLRRNLFADFATKTGRMPVVEDFAAAKTELLSAGVISLGRGKGGSVKRVQIPETGKVETLETDTHTLEVAATPMAEEF